MDVCLLWVLCVVRYRSLWRVDHSSRGGLWCVVMCDLETSWMWRPRPTGAGGGAIAPKKFKKVSTTNERFEWILFVSIVRSALVTDSNDTVNVSLVDSFTARINRKWIRFTSYITEHQFSHRSTSVAVISMTSYHSIASAERACQVQTTHFYSTVYLRLTTRYITLPLNTRITGENYHTFPFNITSPRSPNLRLGTILCKWPKAFPKDVRIKVNVTL